jgi:DHA2 family multidrug resistance protein
VSVESAEGRLIAPNGTAFRRRLIMATCMLAASVYSMNITIVSISLPHMQGAFSATPDQIAWVVTSFTLGLTMMVACVSWISNRMGRRRMYLVGLVGFIISSTMCGNARLLEEEVIWRFFQGVSGAYILPLSQAIIIDVYPRERRAWAISVWGLGNMVGPIIAPPIGGYLTEIYGWPAIFYLNIPLGLLTLIGASLSVPRDKPETRRPFDLVGATTLVLGLCLIQFAVNRGTRLDWFESTEIILEFAAAACLLYIFAIHAATARDPFLSPAMLGDRNYRTSITVMATLGLFTFAPLVLLPILLRNLLGYPVDMIGLLLMPRAAGVLIGQMVWVPLLSRIDNRKMVVLGLALNGLASWFMAQWTLDVGAWDIVWTGVLQGFGSGTVFSILTIIAFSTLDQRHQSQGIPVFYLSFNLGTSIGIALIVTQWIESTQTNHARLAEYISPFNQMFRSGAIAIKGAEGAAALDLELTRQAAMIGFDNAMQVAALLPFLAIPLCLFIRDVRPPEAGRGGGRPSGERGR